MTTLVKRKQVREWLEKCKVVHVNVGFYVSCGIGFQVPKETVSGFITFGNAKDEIYAAFNEETSCLIIGRNSL